MAIQLVWFKRDLRIYDHAPLARAAASGPCVGLYVYEPELIEAEDCDASHLDFVNESLIELRTKIRRLGSELLLRTGRVPEVFDQLHEVVGIAKIWAHEETFNNLSYQRDRRLRAWARSKSIPFLELPQTGVVRRLGDRDGWSSLRSRRMRQAIVDTPVQLQPLDSGQGVLPGKIQSASQFRVRSFVRSKVQQGGESNAHECLNSFLSVRGANYRSEMSSPLAGEESCSRLSPYIAYGNISMRTIHHHLRDRVQRLKELKKAGELIKSSWLKSMSSFQSRLSWHCHFMQKLEDEPAIEFENFNRAYDGLREQEFNRDYFEAWCEGRTGFPMIDACMKALQQNGWINFRMRAMLVSFASYHLWLHWREPALYLARLFLDYEPGIHYSQIQMQSGVTGINTIRIYSPIKQAIDQDPKGIFIRRYLPELQEVPDKHLAEPHKMTLMEQSFYDCRIGKDYPAPIVDHQSRYRAARDRIHEHKKLPSTRAASAMVYQKHGSRKSPLRSR